MPINQGSNEIPGYSENTLNNLYLIDHVKYIYIGCTVYPMKDDT